MKTIVLGDYDTLKGTSKKPGKVAWLIENGIHVDGIQIISLAEDLLPQNLMIYDRKIKALLDSVSDLERVSVALLCWPKIKTNNEHGQVTDVAASTFLGEDLYSYALHICVALQEAFNETGISVDISYHPMLTWPSKLNRMKRIRGEKDIDWDWLQKFLWRHETTARKEFQQLLNHYGISDVGINVENEPTTSDLWANLTHTSNRLFSEQVHKLPRNWGVTADLQHCAMILECIRGHNPYPPPFVKPKSFDWENEFSFLRRVRGTITFHVSQMKTQFFHETPPINFNSNLMDWPTILQLMKELDEKRNGQVWYAVEQDGGHNYPDGYKMDLKAFRHLEDYFSS
jgi:hypothetical protein